MRFLFSCVPLVGHFRPLLPLARSLEAAGHELAFATALTFHPEVEASGFRAVAAGASHADAREEFVRRQQEILALPPEARRPPLFSANFALGHAPRKLPELLEAVRGWRPDGIVHESADLAAPIAAATVGVPSVNHSFGAMVPLKALERAAEESVSLWHEVGLEPEPYAGAFRGLYVDVSPPSFAWEKPLGASVQMRPVSVEPTPPPVWLDELPEPRVYITLGTLTNEPALFQPLLEGLGGVASALVTTGPGVDPGSLERVPPNVRVERFVPQASVLPLCAAAVTHGGSGSTLGALAYGLPLLLVPNGADQFDNAARCAAAGAAVVLMPDEVTSAAVTAGLRRVLDEPSFALAAEKIAAEIGAMPTPDEAAREIEKYVTRR